MARALAKDHHDKRDQILKCAASVFATDGFDRASMASVAAATGISKATIYHYFSSKDELLFGILDNHLSKLKQRIVSLEFDSSDPVFKFERTVREILLAYHGVDDEHQVQINALSQVPKPQQTILKAYQAELVNHLSTLLLDVAPHYFLNDKQKVRSTSMSIFGMLNWFYLWNRKATKQARVEYAALVCDLILNGIIDAR